MQREIRIYLHHTDATGVIYYPSLFTFHIEMIEEILLKRDGMLFPMRHATADCYLPIFHGELLLQEIQLLSMGTTSLTFQSRFMRGETLVAECSAVHVQVCPKTYKPQPLDLGDRLIRAGIFLG